ncbi:MAG TPA: hypothetical protein VN944_03645 [Nitrospiria bacterium]|nr:hypothetical protein [Nitrospiria bacterium]
MPGQVSEETVLVQLRKESRKFRDVEITHEKLSVKLEDLQKRKTILPSEEAEIRKLHKEKLALKDSLAAMVREYRKKQQ